MGPRRRLVRLLSLSGLAIAVLGAGACFHPRVRYVLTAASYQLELLVGRVPLERALQEGSFTPAQRERLEQVPQIRAFARGLGLADRGHYSTLNPTWKRTVYNVSACEPLAFKPRTWWFPIVGTVPYLGYFDEPTATREADRLRAQGLDVYVRTAGAWSTLGWFKDPLLPAMADWDEARLANTLMHELTHATVWIPGSVAFNESLANFVGDVAALRYLEHTYGEDSLAVQMERRRRQDRETFQALMRDLYQDLDALYASELSDTDKLAQKKMILDGLPARVGRASLHDAPRWQAWVTREPWNNAMLVQFRVYNRSPEWFSALLEQEEHDLARFLTRVQKISRKGRDPYQALEKAVLSEPPP